MSAKQKLESPVAARIYAIILAAITSYFGYGKIEEYRAAPPAKVESSVSVSIESIPDSGSHSHGPVLSRDVIAAIAAAAVAAQHEKDLRIFKQREEWE